MEKETIRKYLLGMFDYKPTSYQLDFVHSCINHKEIVAVFSRQSGKSTTTGRVAVMLARRISNNPILVFAPTDRQAGIIAAKITETISKMPYAEHFYVIRQTLREFYFSNGGSIICQTTGDTGQTILGFTAGAIILEEAGSIKDSIVHTAILPMGATTNPPIIKIGTPKGKNHFYESSINSNCKVHCIDYKIAVKEGIVNQSYVDYMKTKLTDLEFKTEMCAEFIEDQDAYFGYELIESCVADIPQLNKPSPNKTYTMGCDIARLGQDSTTFVIVEHGELNKVVKLIEINKSKLDVVVDEIVRLDGIWNFNQIYIDETGLGAGVVDFLSRQYNQTKLNQSVNTKRGYTFKDKIVGVRFTLQSKLDMFSGLKTMMEQGHLKIPNHKKLISQLRDFRYELTKSNNIKLHHSEYGHDDAVDALVLACKGLGGNNVVVMW